MVLKWEMKGFRFRPTDLELIEDYLNQKNLGNVTLVHEAINEINICRFDPWDLRGQSKIQSDDDHVWYFFSPRDTMSSKSKRVNRKTENGYWKVTGRDRSIKGKNQKVVGTKKTLVFYRGRVPNGVKTAWVMHEYQSSSVSPDKGVYVLCKVKDKSSCENSTSSGAGFEPSHLLPCNSKTITQQVEEPPKPVCETDGFEAESGLYWDDLNEQIPFLDCSIIDQPPLSLFESSFEGLEFENSVLADHVYSLSEPIHAHTTTSQEDWSNLVNLLYNDNNDDDTILSKNLEDIWESAGDDDDDRASIVKHGHESDDINVSEGGICPPDRKCLRPRN